MGIALRTLASLTAATLCRAVDDPTHEIRLARSWAAAASVQMRRLDRATHATHAEYGMTQHLNHRRDRAHIVFSKIGMCAIAFLLTGDPER
jgi:1,6-anhydro-N-acetylmuramate kinase